MTKRVLPTTDGFQLMHIIVKTTGKGHGSDRWTFSTKDKLELQSQLKRFLGLFAPIQLISFCCLSNHAHIIINIPPEYKISRSEVAARYHQCYPNRKIHPNSHACQKLQKELNNISAFMQRFARDFALRFNQTRKFKRTGHLWQRRFHNTNLGDDRALLKCWVYVIFNPVKANMINSPFNYKFSSINCSDSDLKQEALDNFYALYKQLSGQQDLTIDEFRKMIMAILQTELDEWNKKNKQQKTEYRQANHFWDRLNYVDKHHFGPE